MREWFLIRGRRSPVVTYLERGELLLGTREKWTYSYLSSMFCLVLPGALLYTLVGSSVVLWVPEAVMAPICGGLVLLGYNLVMAIRTLRDISRGGATPGIYELGLEMPVFPISGQRTFIPWLEVEDVELRRYPSNKMVLISVRGSRWRWRFPYRMIGPRGLRFIEGKLGEMWLVRAMEQDDKVHITVPRLVVYSASGPSLSTDRR